MVPEGIICAPVHLSTMLVDAPTTVDTGCSSKLLLPGVAVKSMSFCKLSPLEVSKLHELVGSVEMGLLIALVSLN